MPMLQIRDLPEHLYKALKDRAEAERRSLAQQAVLELAKGLDMTADPRARRRSVIAAIRGADHTPYQNLPDAAKLIREDRGR